MIAWDACMDIVALHRQGHSQRAIAKKLGIHRSTVKKHIEQGQTPRYQKGKRQERVLAPYYLIINDFMEQDDYRATWVYKRLRQLGYAGGIRYHQTPSAPAQNKRQRQAYVRFETVPDLQGQMAWADFRVSISVAAVSLFICSCWFWASPGPCLPCSLTATPLPGGKYQGPQLPAARAQFFKEPICHSRFLSPGEHGQENGG